MERSTKHLYGVLNINGTHFFGVSKVKDRPYPLLCAKDRRSTFGMLQMQIDQWNTVVIHERMTRFCPTVGQ